MNSYTQNATLLVFKVPLDSYFCFTVLTNMATHLNILSALYLLSVDLIILGILFSYYGVW